MFIVVTKEFSANKAPAGAEGLHPFETREHAASGAQRYPRNPETRGYERKAPAHNGTSAIDNNGGSRPELDKPDPTGAFQEEK